MFSFTEKMRVTLRFRAPGGASLVELPVVKSEGRFTALVPPGTPPGEAEVVVSTGAGKTFTSRIWIASSNFGLFADAAQVWRNGPERPRLTAPILPGEWVTLWGTGLGNASTLAINVAGISVTPSFAGPAPGQPGLDQINFQFPLGVPEDCYIPVTAAVAGGRTSNVVVVPAAAAPGPCRHRLGLGAEDLATLDAGGQIPVSQTWVHSDVIYQPDAPSRYGRFDSVSLDMFLHGATGVQLVTGIRDSDAPREGCVLNGGGGIYAFLVAGPPFDSGRPEVAGPGRRWPMEGEFAHFQAMLSDPEQTYDLAVGAALHARGRRMGRRSARRRRYRRFPRAAPHRAAAALAQPRALPRVGRSADLTLSWDPAGYTDRERVRAGLSRGMNGISCEAPATAGSITIPASLIARVPPDARGPAFASLLLVPSNVTPALYSLPLKDGGVVRGVATFSYLEGVTVTWE